MRFHRELRDERYDVVVIGSGIGGLAAASILARLGQKVAVVERHDRPGGYLHAFRRGGFRFDSAVHLVGGCGDIDGQPGLVKRLLSGLDVEDRCQFIRADPFYTSAFPGTRIDVAAGLEGFVASLASHFPAEKEGLTALVEICRRTRSEIQVASELGPGAFMQLAKETPTLFQYRRATVDAVAREYLSDPRARTAFGAIWPYLGLPPSRLSFLYFATMLMSYVEDGAYYCKGSFQKLAAAFGNALVRNGGELLLDCAVRKIEITEGTVAGVVLEHGQRVAARTVISNVDATQTFNELIGPEQLETRVVRALQRSRKSLSAFLVYGGTTLDLAAAGATHEMFLYDTWDHEADDANLRRGNFSRIGFSAPSLTDPTLAPDGHHAFQITVPVPYDLVASWKSEKERITQQLIERAENWFPGLRDTTVLALGATPRTLERYTLNRGGAMYGWELAPDQVGPGRLPEENGLPGLILAGHWTRPGAGVYGALSSGVAAARRTLGLDEATLWKRLDAG